MKIIIVVAISIVNSVISLVIYHQFMTVRQQILLSDLSSQMQSMQVQLDTSHQDNRRLEALVDRIQTDSSPASPDNLDNLPDELDTVINAVSGQAKNTNEDSTDGTTSLKLDSVLPGSVEESQGLLSGDEIVFYDGRRVYDILDIRAADESGYSGQMVQVEIQRAGSLMTITLPRGSFSSSRK